MGRPVASASAAGQTKNGKAGKRVKPLLEPALETTSGVEGNSKFTRALGSTDYMTREKGLQALQRWMQKQKQISVDDMKRVWKGLFYCFWMSDKAPVQEDLAQRLADILQSLAPETAYTYFTVFIVTMRREWFGIDRLRLDKFLMLVRKFITSMFKTMGAKKWDATFVERYMSFLRSSTLVPGGDEATKALGLAFHLADLFVPELLLVASESQVPVSAAAWDVLLDPFCGALVASNTPTTTTRIREGVFDSLVAEMRQPSESDPLKHLDKQALAGKLFDLGAQASTPAKSRAVLYELSEVVEKASRKHMRMDSAAAGVASGNGVHPIPSPSCQGDVPDVPVAGTQKKKKVKIAEPATPPAELTEEEVKVSGKKLKKKNKMAGTQAAADTPVECAPELSAGKSAGKKRKTPVGSGGGEDASFLDQNTTPQGSVTTSQKGDAVQRSISSLKKLALRDQHLQEDADNPVGTPVAGLVAEPACSAGNPKGPETKTPLPTTSKKRVKISLKNNLYFAFGGPVPDPDLRTPPPARSKGGILKKIDYEIPTNLPKTAPPGMMKGKRRVSAGELQVNLASEIQDTTPSGAGRQVGSKTSPKSAPRARANMFF